MVYASPRKERFDHVDTYIWSEPGPGDTLCHLPGLPATQSASQSSIIMPASHLTRPLGGYAQHSQFVNRKSL